MSEHIPGQRLEDFLRSHGDIVSAGVRQDQILEFELRYGVQIPQDFKAYLLTMNGSCGNYGYRIVRFWALGEINSLAEEIHGDSDSNAAVIQAAYDAPIENGEEYFIFADFLDESQLYAIRISPHGGPNEIVILDGSAPTVVADTFSSFVDLFISFPDKLRVAAD